MTQKTKSLIPGVILITIGAVLLLRQLDVIYLRWHHVYPAGMLALALALFYSAFAKKDRTASFPGTILLILGAFFTMRNFNFFSFDYYFYHIGDFWPVFLIAVGAAFVVQYLFKHQDLPSLIMGGVLLLVGSAFFVQNLDIFYWFEIVDLWPLLLIAFGVAMVARNLQNKPHNKTAESIS